MSSSSTEKNGTAELKLASCDMRPATVDDIPAIVATLEAGRALLAASGIDQWQRGTGPGVKTVTEDVSRGWGRVFLIDGQVAATAALIDGPDPCYEPLLEGGWETRPDIPSTYATIHRVAVSPAFRGHHVAHHFYGRLIEEARARGFAQIRVDTHPDNLRMQHVINDSGFKRIGCCCVDGNKDDIRWAYQLFL